MMWSAIGYAALCIVTPMAWGLLIVRISNAIEQRVRDAQKPGASQDVPPIEYHI